MLKALLIVTSLSGVHEHSVEMPTMEESDRARTVGELEKARIPYDMLLMGFADTGRVLINDVGSKGLSDDNT
jgi:hypothetical protein